MPRLLARRRSRKINNGHVTPYPTMAAKERRDQSNTKLCIGNYVLGTTLGVGTFGKVKRKYSERLFWLNCSGSRNK